MCFDSFNNILKVSKCLCGEEGQGGEVGGGGSQGEEGPGCQSQAGQGDREARLLPIVKSLP